MFPPRDGRYLDTNMEKAVELLAALVHLGLNLVDLGLIRLESVDCTYPEPKEPLRIRQATALVLLRILALAV